MAQHVDMNGLWTGTYAYDLIDDRVAFTAWFDDQNGTLGGTITEPNTFVSNGPDELDAIIKGSRHGILIDFIKSYSKNSGVHQSAIYYEGESNPDFTRVSGIWRFQARDVMSGTFTLSRISHGMEKAAKRRVETVER